jgi:hypothetical protein
MAGAWTFLNRCFGGASRKNLLRLILVAGTYVAQGSIAQAAEPGKGGNAAIVLTDKQLDSVTAASANIDLDLSAFAEGPNAVTSTEGSVSNASGEILRAAIDPSAPDAGRARSLGMAAADFTFASGQASASGASSAECSAALTITGNYDFLIGTSARSVTPTSAICSCAAFGISLVGQ